MRNTLVLLFALALCSRSTATHDLVICGGRVVDAETGFDAVRNVGGQGNQIAVITEDEISGRQTLNAGGRVVAGWYAERECKTSLNFGATISHPDSRQLSMGDNLSRSV